MVRLRAPGGCPWDREQTFDSIKRYTLEETYEVLEAIDNRDWPELAGELGDLLLQVLFYAQMAEEEDLFSIDDVLDALSDKLIRRHPHVFGNVQADSSLQVKANWEALKEEERRKKRASAGEIPDSAGFESLLSGVSSKMPALLEAQKISSKAAHAGFDWPAVEGLFHKLAEETRELREILGEQPPQVLRETGGKNGAGPLSLSSEGVPSEDVQSEDVQSKDVRGRIEDEVGDLFFVLVNLARRLSVDPESALRRTNRKFRRRFGWMERQLHAQGRKPEEATLEQMEALWQQAKHFEAKDIQAKDIDIEERAE